MQYLSSLIHDLKKKYRIQSELINLIDNGEYNLIIERLDKSSNNYDELNVSTDYYKPDKYGNFRFLHSLFLYTHYKAFCNVF